MAWDRSVARRRNDGIGPCRAGGVLGGGDGRSPGPGRPARSRRRVDGPKPSRPEDPSVLSPPPPAAKESQPAATARHVGRCRDRAGMKAWPESAIPTRRWAPSRSGYSALAARFTTDPDMAVSVVRATALAPTPTLLQEVAQGTEALADPIRPDADRADADDDRAQPHRLPGRIGIADPGRGRLRGHLERRGRLGAGNDRRGLRCHRAGVGRRGLEDRPDRRPADARRSSFRPPPAATRGLACLLRGVAVCDPLTDPTCVVKSIVGGVSGSIFDQLAKWWSDAYFVHDRRLFQGVSEGRRRVDQPAAVQRAVEARAGRRRHHRGRAE